MRTTSRTFLLLLTLLMSPFAHADIVLNPRGTNLGHKILSYRDFDDIRIDSNGDGIVDTWFLKKGNLALTIRYENGAAKDIEIQKYGNQQVSIKRFNRSGKKFNLTLSTTRPGKVMFGDLDQSICVEQTNTLKSKVDAFGSDIKTILASVNTNPKSCENTQIPDFTKTLTSGRYLLDDNTEKISKCLNDAGTINNIDLKLVSTKVVTSIKRILDDRVDTVFSCESSNADVLKGSAGEEGKFKLLLPKATNTAPTSKDILVLMTHEILHTSGIEDEEMVKEITTSCLEDGRFKTGKTIHKYVIKNNIQKSIDEHSKDNKGVDKNEIASASTAKNRSPSSFSGDESISSINMKSEISNAEAIPSGQKLAATSTDKSPAGKEAALRESVSESAPVFRMANQVMGASNTPAIADSSDSSSSSYSSSSSSSSYSSPSYDSEVGSGSSSRGSSSKSTGQRYQSRYGRYQSKDGVGSDEYVAEEIDLTKNTEAQSARNRDNSRRAAARTSQVDTQAYEPATQASASGSRGPASATEETSKNRRAPAGARVAGDGAAAVGGSTGSASLDTSGGGGGGSQASTSRNQKANSRTASASRAPASANQGSPAQRRELMDSLKDDNYVLMKRKLKEQSYQDELSANGITVMDTYGGRWGANQGAVIYLDNGDRFIRQR